MVTLVIDEWTIVSIAIPFVIVAFMLLFFSLTETKSQLKYEQWGSSYYERKYKRYQDMYLEYRQKYEELQKTMEEDHVKH